MTELKSYSLPELETLAEQIKAEIHKREQEEQEAVKRQAEEAERSAAAEAARVAAEIAAKAAADAAEKARKENAETLAKAGEALPVRFMHPSNRALTWSGNGPTPDWVNAWLATGGTLYALEIAAEKLAPKPIPDSLRPH